MHSKLHSPLAVFLGSVLGVRIKRLAVAAGVVAAGRLEAPATIILSLNDERLLRPGLLRVGKKFAILLERQVTTKVPNKVRILKISFSRLDVGIVAILLQEKDLLLLHKLASRIDAEPKSLGSKVVPSAVAQPKAPADGVETRHFLEKGGSGLSSSYR